jgi:hypothetical protein
VDDGLLRQQRLYFFPLPQGQREFRLIFPGSLLFFTTGSLFFPAGLDGLCAGAIALEYVSESVSGCQTLMSIKKGG